MIVERVLHLGVKGEEGQGKGDPEITGAAKGVLPSPGSLPCPDRIPSKILPEYFV